MAGGFFAEALLRSVARGESDGFYVMHATGFRDTRLTEKRSFPVAALSRRSFILFPAIAVPAGRAQARRWEQPQFPHWTPEFIERLLSDSPWARPLSVTYLPGAQQNLRSDFQIGLPPSVGYPRIPGVGWPGGPTTGRSPRTGPMPRTGDARSQMHLTIRWSSALPIRQALALERFGRDGLDSPKAVEALSGSESEYVIEVFGVPASVYPKDDSQFEKDLTRTARLSLRGRRPAAASSVTTAPSGSHLVATLRFPRFDHLQERDGALELSLSAGTARIEQRFKLETMTWQGKVEL